MGNTKEDQGLVEGSTGTFEGPSAALMGGGSASDRAISYPKVGEYNSC